jgi:uncharacterized membrane protein YqjE
VVVEQAKDQSVGNLVQQAANQAATLVRDEIKLAQLELQEKGKRAGIGAGLFGGSGVVALYGVGALVAAAIMLLATAMDAWLAGTIVGVALLALAGVLALTGKKEIERATPPAPEEAIESARTDVHEIKQRVNRG